jgi:hypothetical protein
MARGRWTCLAAATLAAALLGGCGSTRSEAVVVRHRSCPLTDGRFAPSPAPATRASMVPGKPVAVLVCRYWGENDLHPQYNFAGERHVTDSAKLLIFARKLNALKPISTAPAPSCPVLGGRSVLLLFRYSHEPDDPVRILKGGCVGVSNGHLLERYGLGLPLGEHWPDEGAL